MDAHLEDRTPAEATLHRLRLTARAPIGSAIIGCSGARVESPGHGESATPAEAAGVPRASLDLVEPGSATPPRTLIVEEGAEIDLDSGRLHVLAVHPWAPGTPSGVELLHVPWADPATDDLADRERGPR